MWTPADSRKTQLFFDRIAPRRRSWKRRRHCYHQSLTDLARFIIPEGRTVLEIGCGTGELLAALRPSRGVGVDISPRMLALAHRAFPTLDLRRGDAHDLKVLGTFDYVIMSDLIGHLQDIQRCFGQLRRVTTTRSRVLITYYNKYWQPFIALAERLGLKTPAGQENWLVLDDIENLLELEGFEVVKRGCRFLFPFDIPILTWFCNRILANLPLLASLCLIRYIVAKQVAAPSPADADLSTSVIIPTMNEMGNIEGAVERTPIMGRDTELIFIDGHSTDGTVEKIQEMIARYPHRKIRFAYQDGKGKANAVFKGFDMATGDILMILDSDITVPPEDLPKFHAAIAEGRAEFVNGCRLVYPMEQQAMRTLNYIANHLFSITFTWLLGQRLKDTLCGTKVLKREDYEEIRRNRGFFGDFDPFGDFDLLFGAAKLNLKILDMPIRYRDRTYGDIKIHRFRHGLLLLRMCAFAARRLKFIG